MGTAQPLASHRNVISGRKVTLDERRPRRSAIWVIGHDCPTGGVLPPAADKREEKDMKVRGEEETRKEERERGRSVYSVETEMLMVSRL